MLFIKILLTETLYQIKSHAHVNRNSSNHAQDYKTFVMLSSAEHKVSTTHRNNNVEKWSFFLAFNTSGVVFIMLINVKMPTGVGIFTLMSRINFVGIFTFMSRINHMLSWVEHEKSVTTSKSYIHSTSYGYLTKRTIKHSHKSNAFWTLRGILSPIMIFSSCTTSLSSVSPSFLTLFLFRLCL